MSEHRGYRVESFSGNRQMVAASAAVSREKATIHLLTEVDITGPRHSIADHRERTGERLSLTGYIVTCLAGTLNDFPRFNSFRRGNRLVVLDDVTISVLFEREIDGENVPEPIGIRRANRKTCRQVNDELRSAQQEGRRRLGSGTGTAWIRFVPRFLLRTFIRLASRSIAMQKRFGVVGVTSVGMFGSGPMWPVPLTSATVTVAVGAIVKRPVLIDGGLQEREYLCLTVSFDHDIVDGAPAARFTTRFAELLSRGDALRDVIDAAALQAQLGAAADRSEGEAGR